MRKPQHGEHRAHRRMTSASTAEGRTWMGRLASLIAVAAGCALAAPASAQQATYTCRDERGTVYTLFYPCPKGTKTTSVSVGPTERPQRSETVRERKYPEPTRYQEPAPQYYRYMSPRCRALGDARRSGSSGVSQESIARMRDEFDRDCRDEETAASVRYYKEQREDRKAREEVQRQQEQAEKESEEQAIRRVRQCAESRRILAAKKARADLTPGELNDLRRFEETVQARCPH